MVENKKNKKISGNKIFDYITLGIFTLTVICLFLLCFYIKDYYLVFPKIIVSVFCIIALVILLISVLCLAGVASKDNVLKTIVIVLSICSMLASAAGVYYLNKLNGALNNIIQTESETQREEVVAEFVSYNNNWSSLNDLNGKTVGVLNTSGNDFTSVGKEKLEDEGINVKYESFNSYNDLFIALISSDVDVAIFSKGFEGVFAVNDGYEEYLEKVNVVSEYEKTIVNTIDTTKEKDITKEPFTVLLIGYAPENDSTGLSDSVILASVNPSTLSVTMHSIARDSYVPISCYSDGSSDKLTHSRAISRGCLIDSVKNLMDTDIDYYAEINFMGLVDVVNALGGIHVYNTISFVGQSPNTERGEFTVWVPGYGNVLMNGEQALAFARERHAMPGGDYDRQINQQKVIRSIIKSCMELKDVNKMLAVIDAGGNNFSTNISKNQILSFLNYVLSIDNKNGKVEPFDLLQITNSRITGYSSWMYSYSMELPLWIYRLWDSSIKDNVNLIDENMMEYKKIDQQYQLNMFHDYAFYKEPYVIKTEYAEPQIHDDLPDFVKDFIGLSEEEVTAWARSVGLTLNINYIEQGTDGFNENLAIGTVVNQSEKYGALVSRLPSMTITVNGRTVAIEDRIPYFVNGSYSELLKWINANGYSLNVTWLKPNSASDGGVVVSQGIEAGLDRNKYNSMDVEVYDYMSVGTVNDLPKTKNELLTWLTNNSIYGQDAVSIEYEETPDAAKAGMIKSVSVINSTGDKADVNTVKTNSKFKAVVYCEEIRYTVTFVDETGNVISTESVKNGTSATAPSIPAKEGYTGSWDCDFSNVVSDLTVKLIYNANVVNETNQVSVDENETPDQESLTE